MDLLNIMSWTEKGSHQSNHPSNQNVPILSILVMLEHDEALCNMLAVLIRRIWVEIFAKDIKSVIDSGCVLQPLWKFHQDSDLVKMGQVSTTHLNVFL